MSLALLALLSLTAIITAAAAIVVVTAHLQIARVVSDSMSPSVERGDAVVVRPSPRDTVTIGQIVLLPRGDSPNGPLYAHRIVGVRRDNGVVIVQTKGDANQAPDVPWLRIESGDVPLVVGRLPLSRLPLQPASTHTLAGVTAIMCLLLAWAVWPMVRGRRGPEPQHGA